MEKIIFGVAPKIASAPSHFSPFFREKQNLQKKFQKKLFSKKIFEKKIVF